MDGVKLALFNRVMAFGLRQQSSATMGERSERVESPGTYVTE